MFIVLLYLCTQFRVDLMIILVVHSFPMNRLPRGSVFLNTYFLNTYFYTSPKAVPCVYTLSVQIVVVGEWSEAGVGGGVI